MKIVDDLIGCTQSTKDSANVALNAAQEAYSYLEAERKGTLGPLMRRAIENMEKSGIPPQDAINMVATRGQYLKEMSRGDKMFYQAAIEIKAEDKKAGGPSGKSIMA